MTLEFHPFVLEDVRMAAQSYDAASSVMADAFLAEVSARLGKVLDNPEGFPACGPQTSFRRAKLWRFPQSIVYRVEEDVVYVSLIAQAITNEEPAESPQMLKGGLKLTPQREKRFPV
jgi:hypothetical protein